VFRGCGGELGGELPGSSEKGGLRFGIGEHGDERSNDFFWGWLGWREGLTVSGGGEGAG
jgi:hypothetical protein